MVLAPGVPPFDTACLVLYASIGGAIWFAISARRRRCLVTLNVVGTISCFNGTLIAALSLAPYISSRWLVWPFPVKGAAQVAGSHMTSASTSWWNWGCC